MVELQPGKPHIPKPPARSDEDVVQNVAIARSTAGEFLLLGAAVSSDLAWRCEKAGEAIHAILDDLFGAAR